MKVPKARKLPSGMWFIQLRLNGESIPITARNERECIRQAQYVKAEYLAGKREIKEKTPETPTLTEAIDRYISQRQNILSPSTIRGYRAVQRTRFKSIMSRKINEIGEEEWQSIINAEAALCSVKTLRNSLSFVRSVIRATAKRELPQVKLGVQIPHDTQFLKPDEIPIFISAAFQTRYAVPLLCALSSMRASELAGLKWENIPPHPAFIRTKDVIVFNEKNQEVEKPQAKNQTSTRNVPILIPELKECIERDRKPSGPVLEIRKNSLLRVVHRICQKSGITDVTVHGLRHSFASLCYHLQVPEKIVMEIGGWHDIGTLHRIYTHIAQSDISRYEEKIANFYAIHRNANKNANKKKNA